MGSDDVVCSVCKSSAGISTTCFVCDAKKWLERKHRIATLERERDEAAKAVRETNVGLVKENEQLKRERDEAREKGHEDRRKAHDLLNENLELRGQLAALKALCGEAADIIDQWCSVYPHLNPDIAKRLRAAKEE